MDRQKELCELKFDLAQARCVLAMCPRKGKKGFTSVTVSIPGSKGVTLTAESRANIQSKIDAIKARIAELKGGPRGK